ncbi:MAG: hypothetical protein HYS25_11350 [Ignavibacteriales bacterium]|nr:hypothetical protein [Ignavibacteriales bacterium]
MKKFLILLAVLAIVSCSNKKEIHELLKDEYQASYIPQPQKDSVLNVDKNHHKEILVLLNNGIDEEVIKEYFNLTDVKYKEVINELYGEGLIKKDEENKFVPACMIVDGQNGAQIKNEVKNVSRIFAEIIVDRYSQIKAAYSKIPSFKNIPFDSSAGLIINNAVLNGLQTKNINEKFVKADPPKHGARRYYFLLQRKNYFSSNEKIFEASKADEKKIEEMTSITSEDILNQLEINRPLFVKNFLNSPYKDKVSFREWFVWIYQFACKDAVEILKQRKFIK